MSDIKKYWQEQTCKDAVSPGFLPIEPEWDCDDVPRCSDGCAYYDGKRCELIGSRPDQVCEVAAQEMARVIDGVVNSLSFTGRANDREGGGK